MSARKRSLPRDDSPEDSSDESLLSSSPEASKRARLSDANGTPRSMGERMDLNDITEHELAEVYAEEIQGRKNARMENVAAEGGIVEGVTCENFMCHRNFAMDFGPFMNFVIGHNGSGKSAVLTALTLCLGGKATSTNRGSSLKSLIKEGETHSRLTVKLKNGGEGFKKDKYGESIIVERKFNRDGSSGYRLLSKEGHAISNKKEELDELCDFYGLQIDNPMTILTQDAAREFLSNSSNAKKYELFNRGVQLEQLDQDYSIIQSCIKNTENILETKAEAVEAMGRKVKEAEHQVKQFDATDGLRVLYNQTVAQASWAQVEVKEVDYKKKGDEILVQEDKISKAQEKIEDTSRRFEEAEKRRDDIKLQVEAAEQAAIPRKEEKDSLKEDVDKGKTELAEMQVQDRELRGRLMTTKKSAEKIKDKIKDEKKRLEERDGGSSNQIREDISAGKDKAAALETQLKELERQHPEDQNKQQETERRLENLKKQRESKQSARVAKKEELQSMSSTGDNLKIYPPRMNALVKAITQERRWRQNPHGPLGSYLTLCDSRWSDIVERFFGGALNGFLVSNREDSNLLKQIMGRVGCTTTIFITPSKEFNIQEPDSQLKTVYRVLEFSNDDVRRHFIISNSIEQTILIEDLDEAQITMRRLRREDNVAACYTLHPNKRGFGFKVGGSNGGMGVSPIRAWNGPLRIKADVKERARGIENEIQRLENEIGEINDHIKAAEAELKTLKSSISTYNRRKIALREEVGRQELEISQLETSLEQLSTDSSLEIYEAELQATEEKVRTYETQWISFVQTKTALSNSVDESVNKLKTAEQAMLLANQRIDECKTHLEDEERIRSRCLVDKNHYFSKVEEYRDKKRELEAELQGLATVVEERKSKASEIAPQRVKIPDGQTVQSLFDKLKKLRTRLDEAEKRIGAPREVVMAAYNKILVDHEAAKAAIQSYRYLLEVATRVHKERRTRWEEFQKLISARARAQFSYMMSERNFKGRLRLEHSMQPPELIIEVQPSGETSGNRGPKTLSGGEKSFSTICLLLSLWEAMGSPIRCLDEFDVYMDSVNRSISVDMMIQSAQRSVGKQFILITPQSMSNAGPNVRIHKMDDPERGQTTLDQFVHR